MADMMQALAAATSAISYLRTMKEVSASVDSLSRVATAQEALIAVQNEVLSLQQMALGLLEENRQLRERSAKGDRRASYELFRRRPEGGTCVSVATHRWSAGAFCVPTMHGERVGPNTPAVGRG